MSVGGRTSFFEGRSSFTNGPTTQGRTVIIMGDGRTIVSSSGVSISHRQDMIFKNGDKHSVFESGTTGERSDAKRINNDHAHCGHSPYGRLIGEPAVGNSLSGDVFDGTTISGDTVKGTTVTGHTLYGSTTSGDTVWGSTNSATGQAYCDGGHEVAD
ncbi:hypothetical protein N7523_005562 [Penicillium sp. IBT 18751x]|nr:hypothetical protein N7523_005852 [Penicillium sp. IBT 18751x]KAJ6117811.1 hypothetical protein N7523_005562 [Penicillium sp. IBT 18751x]